MGQLSHGYVSHNQRVLYVVGLAAEKNHLRSTRNSWRHVSSSMALEAIVPPASLSILRGFHGGSHGNAKCLACDTSSMENSEHPYEIYGKMDDLRWYSILGNIMKHP